MCKRTPILLLVFVVTMLLAFPVFASDLPEPSYGGHTLTYWLQENWYDGPEAVNALQNIGTNALPFLVKGIKRPNAPLPGPQTENWKAAHPTVPLELLIVRAFKALGSQATPSIPELSSLTQDPSPIVADTALNALALMGTNGFPPLFAAVSNPQHPYRGRATFLLGAAHFLGSNAEPAVVVLVSALKDPEISAAAAHALGELKLRPDIAVPALTECLRNTNANVRASSANALIWFGRQSQSALPGLTNALADADPEVRRSVEAAIKAIVFDKQ